MKENVITVFLAFCLGLLILLFLHNTFLTPPWRTRGSTKNYSDWNIADAAPNVLSTIQNSKQRQTVSTMLEIEEGLKAYHADFSAFPVFTSVVNMNEFVLPSVYYTGRYTDAWNTSLKYMSDTKGYEYQLTSYGENTIPGGGNSEFDSDITFANGGILAPESLVEQCANFSRTKEDMEAIGSALRSYFVDYGFYPHFSGDVELDEHFPLYQENFYDGSYKDEWGEPFRYSGDPSSIWGYDYVVKSYGKDKQIGFTDSEFDSDILFEGWYGGKGKFVAPQQNPACPYHPLKRQCETADTMRRIGTGLGSYQVDYNFFPQTLSVNMFGLLYDLGYYDGKTNDEWNQSFIYDTTGLDEYSLISFGKDLVSGCTSGEFDSDIIYHNGMFEAPENFPGYKCYYNYSNDDKFFLTAADMRAIGTGLGSYQVDYDFFPQTSAVNMFDLLENLGYYSGRTGDGWEQTFIYDTGGLDEYSLISFGKDLVAGCSGELFDSDILYHNGVFTAPASLVEN